MKIESDVIVIGSGIAGLFFAVKLAGKRSELKISILTKEKWCDSNSMYAQGGIAVVTDLKKDTINSHIEDTLTSGGGFSDLNVVNLVVKTGYDRLKELIDFGVAFTKEENGHLDLLLEGGHATPRVVHSKDHTGKEIINVLYRKAKNCHNITFFENQQCIEIGLASDGSAKGIQSYNKKHNRIDIFNGKVVVLATGGCGQIYDHTTNPQGATGDGISLGIRAGTVISQMNFIQFHPTALFRENATQLDLISESLRGAGAYIVNSKGNRFLFNYDSRGELATRNIVSQAIFEELSATHEESVFLDIRHLSHEKLAANFPHIASILAKNEIDSQQNLIPIVPAAHYQCGGIKVNTRAQTSIQDLYAIGECAETGLHGVNRLASNSLLEALVFSHQASEYISLIIDQKEHKAVNFTQFELSNKMDAKFSELIKLMKQSMSKYATINSLIEDLQVVKKSLKECESFIKPEEHQFIVSEVILNALNTLIVAKTVVESKIDHCEKEKKIV